MDWMDTLGLVEYYVAEADIVNWYTRRVEKVDYWEPKQKKTTEESAVFIPAQGKTIQTAKALDATFYVNNSKELKNGIYRMVHTTTARIIRFITGTRSVDILVYRQLEFRMDGVLDAT